MEAVGYTKVYKITMFSAELQGRGTTVLHIRGRVAYEEVGVVSVERGLEARSSEHHKTICQVRSETKCG